MLCIFPAGYETTPGLSYLMTISLRFAFQGEQRLHQPVKKIAHKADNKYGKEYAADKYEMVERQLGISPIRNF
jgi:hypothetical protein